MLGAIGYDQYVLKRMTTVRYNIIFTQ